MSTYRDSLGNTYDSLPAKPPIHHAKSTHASPRPRRSFKHRDSSFNTRPTSKYARYRAAHGGVGAKAGRRRAEPRHSYPLPRGVR